MPQPFYPYFDFLDMRQDKFVKILVRKPKRRIIRRLKRRWEDNIKMDSEEIMLEGVDSVLRRGIGTSGGLL